MAERFGRCSGNSDLNLRLFTAEGAKEFTQSAQRVAGDLKKYSQIVEILNVAEGPINKQSLSAAFAYFALRSLRLSAFIILESTSFRKFAR